MDIQKPLPLMIGDKAFYTLTSLDPVEIEAVVPLVTETDIDLALEDLIGQAGGNAHSLDDPAWLREHLGMDDLKAIRARVREQVIDANYAMLDSQRTALCAIEIAKRLGQSIPPAHLAAVRKQVEMNFMGEVMSGGMDPDTFLAQIGTDRAGLEATLDEQAKVLAEQDAALGAYAQAKKLDVAEEDYPRLLRMPASRVIELVKQAKAAGQAEQVRESALHNRAMELIVAECVCHYRNETPEEAKTRCENTRNMRAHMGADAADLLKKRHADSEPSNPNLKLV